MVAEGAKPPSSSGGAQGAAGASAAGAGGGLGAWWKNLTSQHGPAIEHHVNRLKTKKFSMPVDVKIDFLRPTVEAMREAADTARVMFYQLPPPVQQAAPFVGVAIGSGLLVFAVQQRRVNGHVSCTLSVWNQFNG